MDSIGTSVEAAEVEAVEALRSVARQPTRAPNFGILAKAIAAAPVVFSVSFACVKGAF